MKTRTKRRGHKLLSVLTALSLSAAAFALPVVPSLTANAGTVINIMTGKWTAIALEYIERGTMRAIGSAAAHAENEVVSDILTTTKKFLGSPMSNTLADIKNMCAQMNKKLDNIASMLQNTQNVLSAKISEVTEATLKTNYQRKKDDLSNIDATYTKIIGLFMDFNAKVQDVKDENDTAGIKALRDAYNSLNSIYESASGISTHTLGTFNFADDAQSIAALISPYTSTHDVSYNISKGIDVGDKAGWGSISDRETLTSYYFQSLAYSDAFDHEMYNDMSAQYSYVAGVVSNYLEAYSLYVSYAAQLIYAGEAEGEYSERDKQGMVDSLWNDYDECCYIVTRALAQMIDQYDGRLSGVMRDYDVNTVIRFDNIKESQKACGYSDSGLRHDLQTSYRNKTSNRLQAYQLRPFGSTTAYALRKTNGSQPAVKMEDLSSVAFWEQSDGLLHIVPLCYTGYTVDYYNLVMSGATSPTCWNSMSDGSQLNGLVNTAAFEKVYTTGGNESKIVKYLKLHGIKSDLPKMDSSNHNAIGTKYDWNPNGQMTAPDKDIDMHFYNVTTLEKGKSMSEEVYDMEDADKKYPNQEVSVFYYGEPQVAVYLPANGGAQYQYSVVDYKGRAASANAGRNVLRSGGTITLRIKPDNGKYIKNLRLCDRFIYDDDHSKGTLTQYVSEDDKLYRSDCGIYPDSDGYYTFRINVPFRDGSVILELANKPTSVFRVELAESENVVSGTQYSDHDAGILAFSNFTGETAMNVDEGENVSVAVLPYTGYICTGIEVKDASGNVYSYTEDDPDDHYTVLHGQKNFTFAMPKADVTIKAIYNSAFTAELVSDPAFPNTSLKFINDNGTVDNLSTSCSFSPDEIVNVEAKAINGSVLTRVIVSDITNRRYVDCTLDNDKLSFVMPAGNVQISAESEKSTIAKYLAAIKSDCTGFIGFADTDDDIIRSRNVSTIQVTPGEEVLVLTSADGLTVRDNEGNNYPAAKLPNGLLSFVMPSTNVELSVDLFTASITDADGMISFVDNNNEPVEETSLKQREGGTVKFTLNTYDLCHNVIHIKDSSGADVDYTELSDNIYSFVMPASDVSLYTAYDDTLSHDYVNGICTKCGHFETPAYDSRQYMYNITNAGNLFWFAAYTNGDHTHADFDSRNELIGCSLMNDIDLENREWTPIGVDEEHKFKSAIHGNGHTVRNLNISYGPDDSDGTSDSVYLGFVGVGNSVVIYNIRLEGRTQLGNMSKTGISNRVIYGSAIGRLENGSLDHVTSCVDVRTSEGDAPMFRVGGICGECSKSAPLSYILGCMNFGSIRGNIEQAAGIAAYAANAYIRYCANVGGIATANGSCAGIVYEVTDENASATYASKVESNYNYGELSGGSVSPIGYKLDPVKVSNCYYLAGVESSMGTGKSIEQFKAGEVGYLVNGGLTQSNYLYCQSIDNNIGPDDYPTLDASRGIIYYIADENRYSNYPDGKAPKPEPVTVTLSIDKDGFIYDGNGNAKAYIVFDATGSADSITAESGSEVALGIYPGDCELEYLTIEGLSTGTKERLIVEGDTFTYTVREEDVRFIPEFIEPVQPEPVVKDIGISTYEELVAFARSVNEDHDNYSFANVWLNNNILAPDDSVWDLPIGTAAAYFNGTFDGKGYAVIGLNVDHAPNGGMFGVVGESGVVRDLAVLDCDFMSAGEKGGGIASMNYGTIDHCISGVNTNGGRSPYNSYIEANYGGGIVCVNYGTIIGSRNSAYVNCIYGGGIACANYGTIYGCANNGTVGRNDRSVIASGGIVCSNGGTIECSYNSGKPNGSNALLAMIAVENDSADIHYVYCSSINNITRIGTGSEMNIDYTNGIVKNSDMIRSEFVDLLNSVTDNRVTWHQAVVGNTYLNGMYPMIKGSFIVNRTLSAGNGIILNGMMHSALRVNYSALENGELFEKLRAVAGGRTMTAYDPALSDAQGNFVPAEIWCAGVTLSVPVSSGSVSIAYIDSDGNIQTAAPDKVENGFAEFTVAEPVAFAVIENTVPSPSGDNVKTGDTTSAWAIAAVVTASLALAVISWRRRRKFG